MNQEMPRCCRSDSTHRLQIVGIRREVLAVIDAAIRFDATVAVSEWLCPKTIQRICHYVLVAVQSFGEFLPCSVSWSKPVSFGACSPCTRISESMINSSEKTCSETDFVRS